MIAKPDHGIGFLRKMLFFPPKIGKKSTKIVIIAWIAVLQKSGDVPSSSHREKSMVEMDVLLVTTNLLDWARICKNRRK
jgi:hypothetical protein